MGREGGFRSVVWCLVLGSDCVGRGAFVLDGGGSFATFTVSYYVFSIEVESSDTLSRVEPFGLGGQLVLF